MDSGSSLSATSSSTSSSTASTTDASTTDIALVASIYQEHDVTAESVAKVNTRIKSIALQMKTLLGSLYEINQRVFRRLDLYFPTDLKNAQKIETDLQQAQASLDEAMKKIPVLSERGALATSWQEYFSLSRLENKLSSTCSQTIQVLQSVQFQSAWKWYKALSTKLATSKEKNNLTVTTFSDLVDNAQALLQKFLEEKIGGDFVRKQTQRVFEDGFSLLERTCQDMKQVLSTDHYLPDILQKIQESLNKLKSPEGTSQIAVDLTGLDAHKITLVGKEVFSSQYYFSGSVSYYNPSSYNYYKREWELSSRMEEVMKRCCAFLKEIDSATKSFFEKDSALEKKRFQDVLSTLQKSRKEAKDAIFTVPLNSMGVDLVNYASLLEAKVAEVAFEVEVFCELICDKNKSILQVQKHLMQYLLCPSTKESPCKTSYDLVVPFYKAAKEFAIFKARGGSHQMINETLAARQKEVLSEIKEEELVFNTILRQEPLEMLLYTQEVTEGVPSVVKSWIIKRVAKDLYREQPKHDATLELILFLLETQDLYKKRWQKSLEDPFFLSVLEDFKTSKIIQERFSKEQLQSAYLIWHALLKVSLAKEKMVLEYVKAVIWLCEFSVLYSPRGASIVTAFVEELAFELSRVAKEKGYLPLLDQAVYRSLQLDAPSTTLEHRHLDDTSVFMCMRIAGTALYGNEEQKYAFKNAIPSLVKNKKLFELIDEHKDLYPLYCELAKVRTLRLGPSCLSQEETLLLKQGPILEYLKKGAVTSLDDDIPHVLYRFVQYELDNKTTGDGSFSEMVKNFLGEERHHEWLRKCMYFIYGIGGLTIEFFLKKNKGNIEEIKKVLEAHLDKATIKQLASDKS
jgi:hypothetical protein